MASNSMCGPSNALKGLTSHVDQDRSLQQGRLSSGPSHFGQSSFRSNPGPSSANNQFAQFQSRPGLLADIPENGSPLSVNQFAPPAMHHQRFMGTGGAPQVHREPLQGNASTDWVRDFQGMNLAARHTPQVQSAAPGFHHASEPLNHMAHANPYDQMAMQTTNEIQRDRLIRGQLGKFINNPEAPLHSFVADQGTQDAFNSDFASSMNQWMAQNCPTASESVDAAIEQGFAQAMADDRAAAADEKLAQNQAQAAAAADPHLAEAARQVTSAVADNQSDKFKNSRFFDLMRQVGQSNVVLSGENFVNASDGSDFNNNNDNSNGNGNGESSRGGSNAASAEPSSEQAAHGAH